LQLVVAVEFSAVQTHGVVARARPGGARCAEPPTPGSRAPHRGARVGYVRTAPLSISPSPLRPFVIALADVTERRGRSGRGWGHFKPSQQLQEGPLQTGTPIQGFFDVRHGTHPRALFAQQLPDASPPGRGPLTGATRLRTGVASPVVDRGRRRAFIPADDPSTDRWAPALAGCRVVVLPVRPRQFRVR